MPHTRYPYPRLFLGVGIDCYENNPPFVELDVAAGVAQIGEQFSK